MKAPSGLIVQRQPVAAASEIIEQADISRQIVRSLFTPLINETLATRNKNERRRSALVPGSRLAVSAKNRPLEIARAERSKYKCHKLPSRSRRR